MNYRSFILNWNWEEEGGLVEFSEFQLLQYLSKGWGIVEYVRARRALTSTSHFTLQLKVVWEKCNKIMGGTKFHALMILLCENQNDYSNFFCLCLHLIILRSQQDHDYFFAFSFCGLILLSSIYVFARLGIRR